MAVLKNFSEDELIISCRCGCDEGIHFRLSDYQDGTYAFLAFTNGNFYKEQGIGFLEKLKKICAIIKGKDYYYSDIVMSEEEFTQFKEWINKK